MVLEQDTDAVRQALSNAWNLQVGWEVCSDAQMALNYEWLVTNGIGGYASGSIVGATTRSYHGLLVAALRPPVERTVLVTKIDEEVTMPGGRVLKLGVNEYHGGVIDPQGYNFLEQVWLEGDIPYFRYRLDDNLTLEKRICMEYGQNTTFVQYVLRGTLTSEDGQGVLLTLLPFCLSRDYHGVTQGSPDWHFRVDAQGNRCRVQAYDGAPVYSLIAHPSASFSQTGFWYWHVLHRRESERGLNDQEDVYQPGAFRVVITPGMHMTLVLSSEQTLLADLGGPHHEDAVTLALLRRQRRTKQLLTVADHSAGTLPGRDPVLARLVLAADQFIVARPDYSKQRSNWLPPRLAPDRKTIIAGYPWFTDWGRDTMIALPGLLLSTGRYSEARGLLKAFTTFMQKGLIPNHFPDQGDVPEYNTADATLWMFRAIDLYLKTTGDWSLLKELFPALEDSIQWHIRGTLYNIGADPVDGLLHAGAPGVQLTWMDAKVDDWVVTPRRGKPVEINALWYAALTAMESWAVRLSIDATPYSQLRTRIQQHFATRFWYDQGGYLYDVVDVDGVSGQNDASLRPNQLFAASLAPDLLTDQQATSMLHVVTEHLLTPSGLRSLSPTDPAYHDHFNGDRLQRDSAYHQGTVWQWLVGPYIDVHWRVYHNRDALLPLLQPIVQQLWNSCIGSISEVTEPEAPYTPAGCFAQAWSVSELLRCWLI